MTYKPSYKQIKGGVRVAPEAQLKAKLSRTVGSLIKLILRFLYYYVLEYNNNNNNVTQGRVY
jgi:hypothetical protein